MPERQRNWGFRLSVIDAMVLVAGTAATWLMWPQLGSMAGIVPMAIGHFFLFCNVFRIHRTKELWWAAACIANICVWFLADQLWWPGILAVQTPLTGACIYREMRGPWYHGIMARRINPRLDEYLEGRI